MKNDGHIALFFFSVFCCMGVPLSTQAQPQAAVANRVFLLEIACAALTHCYHDPQQEFANTSSSRS